MPSSRVGELGEQWRRLERYWRDSLEEATGTFDNSDSELNSFHHIGAIDDVQHALRDLMSKSTESRNNQIDNITGKLSPALDQLNTFAGAIDLASQYPDASALLWLALLLLIQVCLHHANQHSR